MAWMKIESTGNVCYRVLRCRVIRRRTSLPLILGGNDAMDRRSFLTRAGVTASVAATFPAPAIAQSIRELKIVTSWPKGLPGLGTSAERLGRGITEVTDGRLKVQVFGGEQPVSVSEVSDAVSRAFADMSRSPEYFWENRSQPYNFSAAVPFGFTADEIAAWIHFGGGQALWDEL